MRKWTIKLHDYPKISTRKFYQLKITNIERQKKPDGMVVIVQHISSEQEGRCHQFIMPLPLKGIASKGARFFTACGIDFSIEEEFEPRSVIGTIIQVRFSQDDAGSYEPVEFRRVESHNTNDANKHQEGSA